jgi:hypothetical protein
VGRTLTLLILFLVTIVVILVIFSYFTGLISFSGGQTDNMGVSGVFALNPNNASQGTLIFSVSNTGSSSILGVSFSCPSSDFLSTSCDNLTLSNSGGLISPQNPIKAGAGGGGSIAVSLNPSANLQPGNAVTVTVNVTFADGSMKADAMLLPAQA